VLPCAAALLSAITTPTVAYADGTRGVDVMVNFSQACADNGVNGPSYPTVPGRWYLDSLPAILRQMIKSHAELREHSFESNRPDQFNFT
jgi:hypothetical protein